MRQVRICGFFLIALFAMSALASSPVLATPSNCQKPKKEYVWPSGEVLCETVQEHAGFAGSFANCPTEAETCIAGESYYKETWKNKEQREQFEAGAPGRATGAVSYFTAGKVTVPLKTSINLQGGLDEITETGTFRWVAPTDGAPTIVPVQQATIPLTKGVNRSLLAPSELTRYNYYVKVAKETKTYATVELAGPADQLVLAIGNDIAEEGTAFVFPVKVKLTNPFLGENCYVGSNASPVYVPFSTGQSGELHGKFGVLQFESGGEELVIWGDTLVSGSFESPGVQNCGVEGGADEAVDSALGLPASTGNSSVLNGVLRLTGVDTIEERGL